MSSTFALNDVVAALRAGPPTVELNALRLLAVERAWDVVEERQLEVALENACQSDERTTPPWPDFLGRRRREVRTALAAQSGQPRTQEEMNHLAWPELGRLCRLWAEGLRVPPELRDATDTDFPAILWASQVRDIERCPGAEVHRRLWTAYTSGVVPIGWVGRWPEGRLVVAYFDLP